MDISGKLTRIVQLIKSKISWKKSLVLSALVVILALTIFIYRLVLASDFYLNKKIEACHVKNDQLCYVGLIMDTFSTKGLDKALDLVNIIYSQDSSFSTTCHDVGHLLGSETYKLFRDGKPFKISPKAAFCSYGFYHGFMEQLASEGDVKKAGDFCKYVDEQISKETPDASLQCYHGIGHGWVNIHGDTTLIGDDLGIVKKGLALCEKVSNNDSELSRCATGVFNGIAIFYGTNEYGLKIKSRDPLWLCKRVDKKYQDPCFISMNTVLYSVSGGDLRVAAKFLNQIKDDQIARHAMINLAIPFSVPNIESGDNSVNIVACNSLSSRLKTSCFQGLAFAFLEHGEPGHEYIKSIAFCNNPSIGDMERNGCLSYIYGYLAQWYPKDKSYSICQSQGDYKDLCTDKVTQGLEGLTK